MQSSQGSIFHITFKRRKKDDVIVYCVFNNIV